MSLEPVVLCGPSGSGKSTLIKELMRRHQGVFAFSVSHTTRKPRPGETDGVEYHFVDRDKMQQMASCGEFVEHAEFSGNWYGTSRQAIGQVAADGRICLLDVDTQGVRSLKQQPELRPKFVFVLPPSLAELERRLRGRGTESEAKLRSRLSAASEEMQYGSQAGNFHLVVVNDDVDRAVTELEAFLAEDIHEARVRRLEKNS